MIFLYVKDGCTACEEAKTYLTSKNIEFQIRNIAEERPYHEFTYMGGTTVTPAVMYFGELISFGFDQQKLDQKLGI